MEISDRRIICKVKNQDSNLKLEGEVQINESDMILSFSGFFNTLEDTYAGNFYYQETDEGLVDKSVNSFPSNLQNKGIELLDLTIPLIKSQIN